MGTALPCGNKALGQRVERVHPVPGLRRGDPPGHLFDQRHRVPQCPLPAGDQSPGALPLRAGRAEMSVPGHPISGPDRYGQGTMDTAVEASAQCVRDHLRRPIPGSRDLLMETAGNTVSEIVPAQEVTGFVRDGMPPMMRGMMRSGTMGPGMMGPR